MKRVVALAAIVTAIAGVSACTTTQKVVSGVAVGGGTGLLLGGPVGAAAGAAIGGVVVPVASMALSSN